MGKCIYIAHIYEENSEGVFLSTSKVFQYHFINTLALMPHPPCFYPNYFLCIPYACTNPNKSDINMQ